MSPPSASPAVGWLDIQAGRSRVSRVRGTLECLALTSAPLVLQIAFQEATRATHQTPNNLRCRGSVLRIERNRHRRPGSVHAEGPRWPPVRRVQGRPKSINVWGTVSAHVAARSDLDQGSRI